ncbi:MAG: RDD family protein [Nitrospinota bacterium]
MNKFPNLQFAGFTQRVSAGLFDIFAIQAAVAFLFLSLTPDAPSSFDKIETILFLAFFKLALFFFVSLFYFSLFTTLGGQTPGKKVFGIRVINASNTGISVKTAVLRYLRCLLSIFTLFGFLSIIFDRNKQGWHDKWSYTFVISVKTGTFDQGIVSIN